MTDPANSDAIRKWVSQFDDEDVPLIIDLLATIRVIPLAAFVSHLNDELQTLAADESLALYAIRELRKKEKVFVDRRSAPKLPAMRRVGSEGFVASQVVSHLRDREPSRFLNHPSIATLKMKRIHNVAFVDDIIGSGKRASAYIKGWMSSPTLRSWRSYGKLQVHVVVHSATADGVLRVRTSLATRHKPGIADNIHVHQVESAELWARFALPAQKDRVRSLFRKYGKRHKLPPEYYCGFGNAMTTVVYQHKCPNTVPAIFWCGSKTWKPLFPNGTVSPGDVAALSVEQQSQREAVLASYFLNQDRAALRSLTAADRRNLLLLLGVLTRVKRIERIAAALSMPAKQVASLVATAENAGFVVGGKSLTQSGLAVLRHARSLRILDEEKLALDERFYYPKARRGQ